MRKMMLVAAALCAVFAVQAVRAGERLRAYAGTEEPVAQEIFSAFEKETGIKVEWVRLSGGEAITRIEAEKANPQGGIWMGGVGTMHIELKNKGLTAPYSSPAANNVPDKFRDPDKFWIGLYVGPITFCYNTKRLAELGLPVPKGWMDLIKPEYKNQVRVAHPSTSGTAYNMITNIIRIFNGDEDKAFDYLKKLSGSVDQFTRSGSAPGKGVAIGEVPIAIGYRHDQLRLKSQGAPIEIVYPEEGSGYETASMSLIANGPDQVEAKKLYNFILTSPAVAEIFKNWFFVTPQASMDPNGEFNSLKLVNQDDLWDAANKTRLVDRWNREITSNVTD
jgi:iron(III) transport system substrate-binding protein